MSQYFLFVFQVFLVKSTVGICTLRYDYVHFQGRPIRSVSCYALLSRCRLPWPRPDCLYGTTLLLVNLAEVFVTLCQRLVHPTAPVLLTRYGPLEYFVTVFSFFLVAVFWIPHSLFQEADCFLQGKRILAPQRVSNLSEVC